MTVICFPGFPAPFSPFHITLFFSPLSPRLAGPKGLRYADQTRNERGEKVMWKETQREGKGTDYEPRFSVPSLRRVLRLIIGSLSTSLPSPSIPVGDPVPPERQRNDRRNGAGSALPLSDGYGEGSE